MDYERCRVCLENGSQFMSLYQRITIEGIEKKLISSILWECGNVHVYQDDNKPQNICFICTDQAKEAYKFKLSCQRSSEILQHEIVENLFGLYKGQNNSYNKIKVEDIETLPQEELTAKENQINVLPFMTDQHIKPQILVKLEPTIKKAKLTCVKCGKNTKFKSPNKCLFCDVEDNETLSQEKNLTNKKVEHLKREKLINLKQTIEKSKLTCDKCGRTCSNKSRLKTHTKSHTCLYCGYFSTDKMHLTKHIHEKHAEHKNCVCPDCGKRFFTKQKLSLHMHTHSGLKTHTCDQCGISFAMKNGLEQHLFLHSGEKPFTCAECGKCFAVKKTLETHQAVHSGDRNFVCDICGATFKTRQNLYGHRIRHDAFKRHKCSICESLFHSGNELKRHKQIHSGTRNHQCKVCNKGFLRIQHLQSHMRTHTGEKPNICHKCGKAFNQAVSLRSHLKSHHDNSG